MRDKPTRKGDKMEWVGKSKDVKKESERWKWRPKGEKFTDPQNKDKTTPRTNNNKNNNNVVLVLRLKVREIRISVEKKGKRKRE